MSYVLAVLLRSRWMPMNHTWVSTFDTHVHSFTTITSSDDKVELHELVALVACRCGPPVPRGPFKGLLCNYIGHNIRVVLRSPSPACGGDNNVPRCPWRWRVLAIMRSPP